MNSNSAKHGKSYWKLNNSILSDDYVKQKIENLLIDSRTRRPAFSSTGEWWDNVITHIKKVAIKHSSVKKRETDSLKSDLKTGTVPSRSMNMSKTSDECVMPSDDVSR